MNVLDFLSNILKSNGYGENLESDVKSTLEYIGYKQVINVDEIIKGNKEEDIRILDNDKFTLVEIKGHTSIDPYHH